MDGFAITTRGLEGVCTHEIATLPGVTITQTSYRRVVFTCASPVDSLLSLRTIDDVFIDVATWSNVGRPRVTLAILRDLSAELDLHDAAAICASLRSIGTSPTFSVTASFVGRRNYSTEEIKGAVAEGIAARHGWEYCSDDSVSDLNVRVFIEHEVAFVGMRLGKIALHQRPYKQVHLAGSLKPPVAAALVTLVDVVPGLRVLDPCCGAGTILIEAGLMGARVQGGDIDPVAVAAARANVAAANISAEIRQWDAQALPLADASVDRIITNLPWGRQVVIDAALATFYQRALAEMRRVLTPAGRIALLTSAPQLVDPLDLQRVEQIEISLFGQTPTVMIFAAAS